MSHVGSFFMFFNYYKNIMNKSNITDLNKSVVEIYLYGFHFPVILHGRF